MIRKLIRFLLPVLLAITSPAVLSVSASETSAITATIPVQCTDAGGTFTIEPQGSAPAASQKTITVADKGKGSFKINFDRADNYQYTIKQSVGSKTGVKYDNAVYDVEVCIIYDDEGNLKSEVVMKKTDADTKSESAQYLNETTKKDTPGGGNSRVTTGGGTGGGSASNVKTSDPAEIGKWAFLSGACILVLLLASLLKTMTKPQ